MQRHRTSRLSRIVAIVAFLLAGTLATGWAEAQGKAPKGPVEITVGIEPGRHARRHHAQRRQDHE